MCERRGGACTHWEVAFRRPHAVCVSDRALPAHLRPPEEKDRLPRKLRPEAEAETRPRRTVVWSAAGSNPPCVTSQTWTYWYDPTPRRSRAWYQVPHSISPTRVAEHPAEVRGGDCGGKAETCSQYPPLRRCPEAPTRCRPPRKLNGELGLAGGMKILTNALGPPRRLEPKWQQRVTCGAGVSR